MKNNMYFQDRFPALWFYLILHLNQVTTSITHTRLKLLLTFSLLSFSLLNALMDRWEEASCSSFSFLFTERSAEDTNGLQYNNKQPFLCYI